MLKILKRTQQAILAAIAICLVTAFPLSAETPEEKGLRIATAIDQLPTLERMISETVLHIYDAQGKRLFSKKSRSASYTKHFRDPDQRLSRSLSYFFSPADDKGNGALMIEIEGDDDDQWLYLKGLRKPKRVLGSDKSSSFMGSDFSNGDVAARDIEDYHYKWLGSDTVTFRGKKIKVEKVQSTFKDPQKREDYGYSKTIAWLHPQSGLAFKTEMYNLAGQLMKTGRLLAFTVKRNKDGKKVYMPTGMEMKNVLKGTKTIMEMENIRTGDQAANIKPDIFKVEYLTRRWW